MKYVNPIFKKVETADAKSLTQENIESLLKDFHSAEFIFIRKLAAKSQQCTIAETNFSSGLNFLLSWRLWKKQTYPKPILFYISNVSKPYTYRDLHHILSQFSELKDYSRQFLQVYPPLTPGYHHFSFENGQVQLLLMIGDLESNYNQCLLSGVDETEKKLLNHFVDFWIINSPPAEISAPKNFAQTLGLLSIESTCLIGSEISKDFAPHIIAAGFVQNKENASHFYAYEYQHSALKINKPHTPWYIAKPFNYSDRNALVIGAGLAGCFIAYFLSQKGWSVDLYEQNSGSAQGASANRQALLFPQISIYDSAPNRFHLSAYLRAVRIYNNFQKLEDIGLLNGSLYLEQPEDTKNFELLASWLVDYPEIGVILNAQKAQDIAGIPIDRKGLFLKYSGCIDIPRLCAHLISNPRIQLINDFKFDFSKLKKLRDEAPLKPIIIASGFESTKFPELAYLPIQSVRGQITAIRESKSSKLLKIPLSAKRKGHVTPAMNGLHYLGATYDTKIVDLQCDSMSDIENLNRVHDLAKQVQWSTQIKDHWSGIRATTRDYLPIVGQVADEQEFLKTFASLNRDSKKWIAHCSPCYPNLYTCFGFGSRGLSTIPLAAEWLAGLINNESNILPRDIIAALSPSRFLRKKIIAL